MYLLENGDLRAHLETGETEFLLTNSIGGYASTTAGGVNTRKYHGLLVASLNPPVERIMTVTAITELVDFENIEIPTYIAGCTSGKPNAEICETDCLKTFKKDAGVHWIYETENGLKLEKSLYLVQHENTALVRYRLSSLVSGRLSLLPKLSIRDHHQVSQKTDQSPSWRTLETDWRLRTPGNDSAVLVESPLLPAGLSLSLSGFKSSGNNLRLRSIDAWDKPNRLENEIERGLEPEDTAYQPFVWEIAFKAHEPMCFYVTISTEENLPSKDPEALIQAAHDHQADLLQKGASKGEALPSDLRGLHDQLVLAADDFIVRRRSTGKATILAGYPWFTDWGRDSMISLSGLTLSAGRPEYFREIYEAFESYMKGGILPNVFPDVGDEPRYNTVDATLWMPVAMLRYYEDTRDLDYVKAHFLPALTSIIEHYQSGTLNNTYMDSDGLIWSGDASTQLTWMDVKVNGWVVTPRHGKAVEINALWYNTLMIGQYFEGLLPKTEQARLKYWKRLSDQVLSSFVKAFWNEETGYLNDVVRGEEKLTCIRPNQLFALSLPYPLLRGRQARQVFEVVTAHLLIPFGLRSLSPEDPEYHGKYLGNVLSRDGAYHRGTGWGWLMGPYLDAFYNLGLEGGEPENEILNQIGEKLLAAGTHLSELCLGQYAENFDGDLPHHGRGCMAQAWSVAELLRWTSKLNTITLGRLTK